VFSNCLSKAIEVKRATMESLFVETVARDGNVKFSNEFDMDMSYTRVLHIKVAYRVPHK
jgi:hypothetical protein